MSVSRSCPRCGRWHDADGRCDQQVALRAYESMTVAQQEAADAAEAISMARYWFKRRHS
jgi:hypothetical protein